MEKLESGHIVFHTSFQLRLIYNGIGNEVAYLPD